MTKLLATSLAVAGLCAFSGCGDDDSKAPFGGHASASETFHPATSASSFTGSYEFEVNGCSTGRHEYSSREQLCSMLVDEALNNGCAPRLRQGTYSRECDGSLRDGSPRDGGRQPTVPELTFVASMNRGGSLRAAEIRGSVQTILEGSFTLQSHLAAGETLVLSPSRQIQFVGMPSECTLSVDTFTNIGAGTALVQFTLVGIDAEDHVRSPGSCASVLRRYAQSGFQIHVIGASRTSARNGTEPVTVNVLIQ